MDDKNNSGSHELKPLNVINSLGLLMTWATLGRELRALDSMNNLGLWMKWITSAHELKALNTMNNSWY